MGSHQQILDLLAQIGVQVLEAILTMKSYFCVLLDDLLIHVVFQFGEMFVDEFYHLTLHSGNRLFGLSLIAL